MPADIQNCGWVFQIQCPLRWEQLAETADPLVRSCGTCLQHVYRCETNDQVVAHAQLGHCVAFVQANDDDDDYYTLGALMKIDE